MEGGQGFHFILVLGLKPPRLTVARIITNLQLLVKIPNILNRAPSGQVSTWQLAAKELLGLLQRSQR